MCVLGSIHAEMLVDSSFWIIQDCEREQMDDLGSLGTAITSCPIRDYCH
jgi:hypothetical protein